MLPWKHRSTHHHGFVLIHGRGRAGAGLLKCVARRFPCLVLTNPPPQLRILLSLPLPSSNELVHGRANGQLVPGLTLHVLAAKPLLRGLHGKQRLQNVDSAAPCGKHDRRLAKLVAMRARSREIVAQKLGNLFHGRHLGGLAREKVERQMVENVPPVHIMDRRVELRWQVAGPNRSKHRFVRRVLAPLVVNGQRKDVRHARLLVVVNATDELDVNEARDVTTDALEGERVHLAHLAQDVEHLAARVALDDHWNFPKGATRIVLVEVQMSEVFSRLERQAEQTVLFDIGERSKKVAFRRVLKKEVDGRGGHAKVVRQLAVRRSVQGDSLKPLQNTVKTPVAGHSRICILRKEAEVGRNVHK